MKNLTAEQILKKTFEHLDEMVDEKGEERRRRAGKAQDDIEKNQQSEDGSHECLAGEENNRKNE